MCDLILNKNTKKKLLFHSCWVFSASGLLLNKQHILSCPLTHWLTDSLDGECLFAHLNFKLKNNKPNNGNWNEIYGRNYFFPLHISSNNDDDFHEPLCTSLLTIVIVDSFAMFNMKKKSRSRVKKKLWNEALDKFFMTFSSLPCSTRNHFYCHLFYNEFSLYSRKKSFA